MHVVLACAFSPCTDPTTSTKEEVRLGTPGKHSCNFPNKLFAQTGTTFATLQQLKPANTHRETKQNRTFSFGIFILDNLITVIFGLFLVQKYSQESSQTFQPLSVSLF